MSSQLERTVHSSAYLLSPLGVNGARAIDWMLSEAVYNEGVGRQLAHIFFWGSSFMTGILVSELNPATDWEHIYTTACMWWGMAVYTSCVASATSTLSTLEGMESGHAVEVERVDTFLRTRQVPVGLRRRIVSYLSYLWTSSKGSNQKMWMSHLPRVLQAELTLALNASLLTKVPIFSVASDEALMMIIRLLKPIVCEGPNALQRPATPCNADRL